MGFVVVLTACAVGSVLLVKLGNPLLDKLILPKEDEEEKDEIEQESFDPVQTDVNGYKELGFVKREVESLELNIGITFFLSQAFPNWFIHLLDTYYSGSDNFKKNPNKDKYESKAVDIKDARKQNDLEFGETGFTLIKMDPSATTDWRSKDDVKHFQEEIRPELMKLFPGATRIEFTSNIVRGGSKLGDQPAAVNGPHLDYCQNDAARSEFHAKYPINEMVKEQLALTGQWDTEEEVVQTLIGIWKPINMKNPVYDHPLAVMDARTFLPEQERPHELHFDLGFFTMDNLNGAFTYDKDQKWYYYSFQEVDEVLVFTQYSKGKHFANPHTSFLSPNRPKSYDKRQSVEMRAAIFFPRKGNGNPHSSD